MGLTPTAQILVDFSAFPLGAEQPADPDEQDGGNGNADTGAEHWPVKRVNAVRPPRRTRLGR
jgi:hypothetical protein